MSVLDEIDPDDPFTVDRACLDPNEVVAVIADRRRDSALRRKAITAAVEILSPQNNEESSWNEADGRIVDALISVGSSGAQEDGELQHHVGDALGLAWIWRREFDRDAYLSLGRVARSAARKVIREENGAWLASIDES